MDSRGRTLLEAYNQLPGLSQIVRSRFLKNEDLNVKDLEVIRDAVRQYCNESGLQNIYRSNQSEAQQPDQVMHESPPQSSSESDDEFTHMTHEELLATLQKKMNTKN